MIELTEIKRIGDIVTARAEGEGDKFRIEVNVKERTIITISPIDKCEAMYYNKVARKLYKIADEHGNNMPEHGIVAWY